MPGHPNIVDIRDCIKNEVGDRLILVTEDVPGEALRQHINKQSLALTFDQKLGIMRNVLAALDHAHKYEVIHRSLTPDSILVAPDGHARLRDFDYARVGKIAKALSQNRLSTSSIQLSRLLNASATPPKPASPPISSPQA